MEEKNLTHSIINQETEHERFIDRIRKRVESQGVDNRFGSAAPYDTHI